MSDLLAVDLLRKNRDRLLATAERDDQDIRDALNQVCEYRYRAEQSRGRAADIDSTIKKLRESE